MTGIILAVYLPHLQFQTQKIISTCYLLLTLCMAKSLSYLFQSLAMLNPLYITASS